MKLKGRTEKYIFREALKDMVPDLIRKRPHAGFSTPVVQWLDVLEKDFSDLCSWETARERGIFTKDFVEKVNKRPRHIGTYWELHSLIQIEMFHMLFVDRDPRKIGEREMGLSNLL